MRMRPTGGASAASRYDFHFVDVDRRLPVALLHESVQPIPDCLNRRILLGDVVRSVGVAPCEDLDHDWKSSVFLSGKDEVRLGEHDSELSPGGIVLPESGEKFVELPA